MCWLLALLTAFILRHPHPPPSPLLSHFIQALPPPLFCNRFPLTLVLQDLIETFTDVGRSWLKKIVRTVVTSAATEAGLNLVIEPPSDKKILFVSVGVSEKEVKDRMMKLKVRVKAATRFQTCKFKCSKQRIQNSKHQY